MKKVFILSMLAVLLVLQGNLYAAEEGLGIEFGADIAVNSKYLWRGIEFNEDPVFQPDVWVSFKGFSAIIWGNMELSNVYNDHGEEGEAGDFTEVDYILDYSGSFKKINYSVGWLYYDFPHTGFTDTHEAYIAMGYDCFLAPTFTLYRDLRANDGYYLTFSISHDIELKKLLNSTLSTSAAVGCASKRMTRYYYGERKEAVTDSLISASLTIPITDNISIIPAVNYSALLDGGIRDDNIADKDDNLWFGVNIALSFGI
ncbi:MAG: hypothetical protein GY868_14715 [Deltaproteobacteria bacterium]|nr:hypothetical protein [Deltaproteobacteria bacterium]